MQIRSAVSGIFEFIVFGNLYISACAVVMFMHADSLFRLEAPSGFIPFIFFATLCSYSFHWYLTIHTHSHSRRLKWSSSNKTLLILTGLISFIAVITFFLVLIRFYVILLLLGLATFIYTAPKIPVKPFICLRKIILLKTTYLTLVWVFTTTVLPLMVSSKGWNAAFILFTINRLFLIFPICLLFDYRDREEDMLEGIKNIATIVNRNQLNIIFGLCMVINFASALFLYPYIQDIYQTAAILIPSVLLSLTYPVSKNSKSDWWFYFYLDGLMMLSGLLSLVKSLVFA